MPSYFRIVWTADKRKNWTGSGRCDVGKFLLQFAPGAIEHAAISQGFQFQFNYTWSKLLDTGVSASSSESGTEVWQVPNGDNTLLDRGPSVYDNTNNARINFIYHAPTIGSEGLMSKAVNGWWFSSIISLQSGYPITPTLGSDRALQNDMQESERPDYAASYSKGAALIGTPAEWFNPTMFSLPKAGTLGNKESRGILRGPGLENVDFSIVKDTKAAFLGEKRKHRVSCGNL